jgi:hypothetical protein
MNDGVDRRFAVSASDAHGVADLVDEIRLVHEFPLSRVQVPKQSASSLARTRTVKVACGPQCFASEDPGWGSFSLLPHRHQALGTFGPVEVGLPRPCSIHDG